MILIIIIIATLWTIALIFIRYDKHHNKKKFAISFLTLVVLICFIVFGNITRTLLAVFIIHNVLIVFAWVALIKYILYRRYDWWIIFSPILTLGFYLILSAMIC